MKRAAPRVLAWLCVGFAVAGAARGQDVVLAPIASVSSDDPPEQLPQLKRPLRPGFPAALKKTTDIGWAMADFFVDEHGTVLSWQTYATQPLLKAAVTGAVADRSKIEPARRSGKPVNARVRMAILFNPASAGPTLADATPRLLDAAAISDPRRSAPERDEPQPEVLWVTASIDQTGQVTGVREVPSELQSLVDRKLRTWRFAPARRAGVAIAAEVRVPVMLLPAARMSATDGVPPRVTHRQDPTYPPAMLRSGLRGEVLLEFTVDIEGRVRNAAVVRSLNPLFDEAALAAIAKWQFEPAREGGVPMKARMRLPVSFGINEPGGGSDGLETRRRGDPSKLPAEPQYDVEPKPVALVVPKFPYALLKERIYGKAEVSLLIGPDGRILRTKVIKADRPEFGLALQAACEGFEYQPALKNAQPTYALIGFEENFRRGDTRLVSDAEHDALALEQKHPDRIVNARKLDRPPQRRITRVPLYPTSLAMAQKKGSAIVAFLIAEDGKVLLPRIISGTDPEFGYAAVQAVSGWQFAPPTLQGKPVITRVQVPFDFTPPPPVPARPGEAQPADAPLAQP